MRRQLRGDRVALRLRQVRRQVRAVRDEQTEVLAERGEVAGEVLGRQVGELAQIAGELERHRRRSRWRAGTRRAPRPGRRRRTRRRPSSAGPSARGRRTTPAPCRSSPRGTSPSLARAPCSARRRPRVSLGGAASASPCVMRSGSGASRWSPQATMRYSADTSAVKSRPGLGAAAEPIAVPPSGVVTRPRRHRWSPVAVSAWAAGPLATGPAWAPARTRRRRRCMRRAPPRTDEDGPPHYARSRLRTKAADRHVGQRVGDELGDVEHRDLVVDVAVLHAVAQHDVAERAGHRGDLDAGRDDLVGAHHVDALALRLLHEHATATGAAAQAVALAALELDDATWTDRRDHVAGASNSRFHRPR